MNIDDLLQSERRRGGFSEDERAAMWEGIERSVSVSVAGAAAAPAAKAAPAVVKAATAKIAGWKLGAMLAAAAIGGAALGVAGHARWGEPKIVQVERPSSPPPPPIATTAVPVTAPEVQTAKPIETQAPPATTPPREIARLAPAPSTAAPPPKDPSLARERTLLDMARTALTRGDAPSALASLDTHAREFPSSQFGPEREVLAIQALASANRSLEARRRAAAFRASYPKSPLLPIVDEATKAMKATEPSEASE